MVGSARPDWAGLLTLDEPQLAVRDGAVLAPRLTPAGPGVPAGPWRLSVERKGSLEGLTIVASDADRPLAGGEVRIGVRAAGLNFRDVLIALGIYPGAAPLGSEAAGVVLEVGSDVEDLAPGDRVMGFATDAFGSMAVADRQMLVPMPAGWTFAQAASVPVAFLTAYHGLVNLAGIRCGERVLVHAAAGGVGMAAVQIAQPSRRRGLRDGERRQVGRRPGPRNPRRPDRLVPGPGLQGAVPDGHRRRRDGCGAGRPGR